MRISLIIKFIMDGFLVDYSLLEVYLIQVHQQKLASITRLVLFIFSILYALVRYSFSYFFMS